MNPPADADGHAVEPKIVQWYADPEDMLAYYTSPVITYVYEQSKDAPNVWEYVRLKTSKEIALEQAAKRAEERAQRQPKPEGPAIRTALYRLCAKDETLLYVGVSEAPLRRWPEHASDKEWWPEVASFSLDWFESRGAALAAEAAAIRAEAPKYNVTHNSARR